MIPRTILLAAALGAGAAQAAPPPPGSTYVAMGSSYAAGPGIAMDQGPSGGRCARSSQNYAAQLARKLALVLVDVSCSGAKTDHVTGPWADLPPQIDAITPATRLVTVTIGGNDINYVGTVFGAACREDARRHGTDASRCLAMPPPGEADYAHAEAGLRAIAAAVHARAPGARLIFAEYPRLLPDAGSCAALPMASADADAARAMAARLAAMTERAARDSGAEVLRTDALSRGHDACSAAPWVNGFGPMNAHFVAVHPNLAGMSAEADALAAML